LNQLSKAEAASNRQANTGNGVPGGEGSRSCLGSLIEQGLSMKREAVADATLIAASNLTKKGEQWHLGDEGPYRH
jgi:hypothetical protein